MHNFIQVAKRYYAKRMVKAAVAGKRPAMRNAQATWNALFRLLSHHVCALWVFLWWVTVVSTGFKKHSNPAGEHRQSESLDTFNALQSLTQILSVNNRSNASNVSFNLLNTDLFDHLPLHRRPTDISIASYLRTPTKLQLTFPCTNHIQGRPQFQQPKHR